MNVARTILYMTWAFAAFYLVGRPLTVLLFGHRQLRRAAPHIVHYGVTFAVPCHNSAFKLRDTIASIERQGLHDYEILLVENNSGDCTGLWLDHLASTNPRIRVLHVDVHPGERPVSVALNAALAEARYHVFVRMDDDSRMKSGTLRYALQMINDGAVAVTCNLRVANPGRSAWTVCQSLEYLLAMELDRRAQRLYNSILCASGGYSVFRTSVLRDAGGYSLTPSISEDMDATLKAHRVGRVEIAPRALGYTTVPATFRALIQQRHRWAISGVVAMWEHRQGMVKPSYWGSWRRSIVGFIGLPLKAALTMRGLFPLAIGHMAATMVYGWQMKLLLFWAIPLALTFLQLAMVAPTAISRQGLRAIFLLPVYSFVYEPLLAFVRAVGTIAGLQVVYVARQRSKRAVASILDASIQQVTYS